MYTLTKTQHNLTISYNIISVNNKPLMLLTQWQMLGISKVTIQATECYILKTSTWCSRTIVLVFDGASTTVLKVYQVWFQVVAARSCWVMSSKMVWLTLLLFAFVFMCLQAIITGNNGSCEVHVCLAWFGVSIQQLWLCPRAPGHSGVQCQLA